LVAKSVRLQKFNKFYVNLFEASTLLRIHH
jgi:hypothetical protein